MSNTHKQDLACRAFAALRHGLSVAEAALYIGIGETKFREMVADGRMPKPKVVETRRIWDVDELYVAFKSLPREGEETRELDTWADVGPF